MTKLNQFLRCFHTCNVKCQDDKSKYSVVGKHLQCIYGTFERKKQLFLPLANELLEQLVIHFLVWYKLQLMVTNVSKLQVDKAG